MALSFFGIGMKTDLLQSKRSHPKSEVRRRSREDPMPKGRWPRGVTPRPRSGAMAEITRLRWRRNGGEELPHVQGQGRLPGADIPRHKPEARGGRREELPHAPKPEAKGGGGEEQPHDQGQGWWLGGRTSRPRSRGCMGAGGPRGAIPH